MVVNCPEFFFILSKFIGDIRKTEAGLSGQHTVVLLALFGGQILHHCAFHFFDPFYVLSDNL